MAGNDHDSDRARLRRRRWLGWLGMDRSDSSEQFASSEASPDDRALLGQVMRELASGAACGRTEDVLTTDESAPGLRGEYFSDSELQSFAGVFVDSNLDFPNNALYNIGGARAGSPTFSIRWTGEMFVRKGERTLRLEAGGGARLWLDGELLIDAWTNLASPSNVLVQVQEDAWQPIRVEYRPADADASLQLLISDSAGFSVVGPSDFRHPAAM